MSLVPSNPMQPTLRLPPAPQLWQRSTGIAENRWQVYLHQLTAATLLPWLQAEFNCSVQVWPDANPLRLWQLIDGLALELGNRRVVVILSETPDAVNMFIPKEWVDLPAWAGDYYIAAYIDTDAEQLALWGYVTRPQLLRHATYDAQARTYCLEDIHAVQDFAVFAVAQQLEQFEPAAATSPFPLSAAEAASLITQAAQSPDSRLALSFDQWGAMVSDRTSRQQLIQARQEFLSISVTHPINLGEWLSQTVDQGWESLSILLPTTPSLAFRAEAEGTTRGKRFSLGTAELVLVLTLTPSSGNRRQIQVQLFPAATPLLPQGIQLSLVQPETGQQAPLQQVQSGTQDNYIQLPRFRCAAGQRFSIALQFTDSLAQNRTPQSYIQEEFIA